MEMIWASARGFVCQQLCHDSDSYGNCLSVKNFFTALVFNSVLCFVKWWVIESQKEHKLSVAKIRLLQWMSGKSWQDGIMNECV